MVRTTVFIDEVDKRALKYEAERRCTSEAELIREGIKHVLDREPAGVTAALPSFVGIARSGAKNSVGDEILDIRKQWAEEVIAKKFGDRDRKETERH